MITDLSGKTAIITGAASGIGQGLAYALADAGMQLALCDIRAEALQATLAEARARGATAHGFALDVSDADAVRQTAEQIASTCGPLHLLCNNAGIAMHGVKLTDVPDADWDWVLGVNLRGVINGVRHFLPYLQAHGGPAHIVNTASIGGFQVNPNFFTGPYSTTKYAVVALSEALANELADSNVGVSVLAPMAVVTGIYHSGRARPERLGGPTSRPEAEKLDSWLENGWAPERVGRRVAAAVRTGEFFIFTHPETREWVQRRHDRLMAAFDAADRWATEN
jgi:NAD(P)-dependent dehydrogenase (short-subunit alcohol dehydrogenase family)